MSDKVITYHHSRKGPVTGVKVGENDEWISVRLVGEQELRYASIENRLLGPHPDGDVVTLRKSLISFQVDEAAR